jgi:hypothetical protein
MESACLRVPSGRASRRVPTSRSRRSQAPRTRPGRDHPRRPQALGGDDHQKRCGSPERARCVGATSATRGGHQGPEAETRRSRFRVRLSGNPGRARRRGGNLQSPSRLGARTTAECGAGARVAVAGWRFQHRRTFSRQPRMNAALRSDTRRRYRRGRAASLGNRRRSAASCRRGLNSGAGDGHRESLLRLRLLRPSAPALKRHSEAGVPPSPQRSTPSPLKRVSCGREVAGSGVVRSAPSLRLSAPGRRGLQASRKRVTDRRFDQRWRAGAQPNSELSLAGGLRPLAGLFSTHRPEGLEDRVADRAVISAVMRDVDGEHGLEQPDAAACAPRTFDRGQRLLHRGSLAGAQAQGNAAGVA